MRRLTSVMTLVLICGVASAALAQDATAAKPPSDAKLRAEIHRTMANLIEAQAADQPDQEQVAKLTEQLRDLRQKLGAPGAATRGARGGGPGMGLAAGRGQGAGPGAGMGRGRGRGMGPAMGPGGGPGPGAGPGAGMGPGRGRGMGPAMGPGGGRGRGQGPGHGWGRGGGPGRGYGPGPGRGFGRGWGFIDENGDGVCDNFEQLWGKP